MSNIHSLWCHGYRGHYIQGGSYDGVEKIRVLFADTHETRPVKSYRAAQLMITKRVKGVQK